MRVTFGAYELDTDRLELLRDGERVSLEPQAFDVLAYLVQHPDRVVSRHELLDAIWGTTFISDSALATRIKEARRAIGDDGQAQRMIRTIHGRGYRFVGGEATSTALHAEAMTTAEGGAPAPPPFEGGPAAAAMEQPAPRPPGSTPFVGRERELTSLREALDAALRREPRVVMLTGEAGIGKTHIALELERYARALGFSVLWGRSQEFPSSPPYWPWVQVFREYRRGFADESWRDELRPYAAELHRFLPEAREALDAPPHAGPADSDDAQFLLFEALAAFLEDVSQRVPVLIVLDDLHWADAATLLALVHVARHAPEARLLVVGTYRDTDVERGSPLHRALAALSREFAFERLHLRSLSRDEVGAFVQRSTGVTPSQALLEQLHSGTEGHPFFLSEVMKLLAGAGTLDGAADGATLAMPAGVRELLDRRLERLSPEAHRLFSIAAVAGREFAHALIAALAGADDDDLIALVEEGLRAHIIEEGRAPGEYRFTHQFVQEALLAELSPPRRARLHGQVAEAIERLAGSRADQEAPALAEHYAAAAVLDFQHARAAAQYSRLAAEQATVQLAWDDAARHYGRCLNLVTAHEDRLGQPEAELWLELALSQLHNGRFLRGDAARRAFAVWPADDPVGLARALLRIFAAESAPPMLRYLMATLDRALLGLGPAPSPEACALLAWKALALRGEPGDLAAQQADEMARALGLDGDEYPLALRVRPARVALDEGRLAAAAAGFEQLGDASDDYAINRISLLHRAYCEWTAGRLGRAETAVQGLMELNREHRRQRSGQNLVGWLAFLDWRRGHMGSARALLAEAPRTLNVPAVDLLPAELALVSGDQEQALAELPDDDVSERAPPGARQAERLGMRARILLRCGQHEAARQAFREWRAALERVHAPDLLDFLFAIQTVEEALLEFADDALLERIMDRLAPLDELRHWWLGSGPDYLRGAIALRLGEVDAAARYFEAGRNWAEEEGIAFVAGRCHEGLAGVATQRGDQATADVHLETAERYLIEAGAPGTSRVTTPERAGFRGHPPDRTSARRERDRE